nr:hypothetical protein [Tanacetum cinerariifolium]
MTRMAKAKENVLNVEIQIISSENAQNYQKNIIKEPSLVEHGLIAMKMKKKRLRTKNVLWLKHLMSMKGGYEYVHGTTDDFKNHQRVENSELVAMFWADEVAKCNYKEFGDMVSFDATFNSNKSKMSSIFAAPQPLNRPEDIPSLVSGSCITPFDEELDEPDAPHILAIQQESQSNQQDL